MSLTQQEVIITLGKFMRWLSELAPQRSDITSSGSPLALHQMIMLQLTQVVPPLPPTPRLLNRFLVPLV
jgi:hypothetical protein